MIERHPYDPFYNDKTKVLIIGTTPPVRFSQKLNLHSDDVNFYYGSRDNYFWDLIGDVFDIKFLRQNSQEAIIQRKSFLTEHKIGLVDIVFEFSRKENNSSDDNLEVIKFQNLYEILSNSPLIQTIYYTGFSGTNSAESLTSRHLCEFKTFNRIVSSASPKHKSFIINNRVIDSFSLYSPSPAARKKYIDRLNQYRLLKND